MDAIEIKAYRRLGGAIVLEAMLEYKENLRELKNASKRKAKYINNKLSDIREFFLSPECDLYAGRENAGGTILSRIEEIDVKDIVAALCAD